MFQQRTFSWTLILPILTMQTLHYRVVKLNLQNSITSDDYPIFYYSFCYVFICFFFCRCCYEWDARCLYDLSLNCGYIFPICVRSYYYMSKRYVYWRYTQAIVERYYRIECNRPTWRRDFKRYDTLDKWMSI